MTSALRSSAAGPEIGAANLAGATRHERRPLPLRVMDVDAETRTARERRTHVCVARAIVEVSRSSR
jgi:hypothetical protein